MSVKATRVTVGGLDLVQVVGAVLLALVAAFVALGGYEFLASIELSVPVSAAAPVAATLVFTLFLGATFVALRRVHSYRTTPRSQLRR